MRERLTISMNERHDNEELTAQYNKEHRVHIPDLLSAESAVELHDRLASQPTWNLVCKLNGKHNDMDMEAISQWTNEQKSSLEQLIHATAETDFQYHYASIPIYDIYQNKLMPEHFVNDIYEFVNSAEFLEFTRLMTGRDDIAFADAQATRYGPGHFLTEHDDNVEGKGRIAAYVINLTPHWRVDWGGALNFRGEHTSTAYYPSFNALNIFEVPQKHNVTLISPFAKADRYSITGWLRS